MKKLLERVVVACNGSKSSLRALMYGILLAKQIGLKLKVVFVVDVVSIKQLVLSNFMDKSEAESIEKNLQEDGKKILENAVRLGKSKNISLETEMRTGSVWSEVISSADEWKANLILLGGTSDSSSSGLNHSSVTKQDNEIIGSARTNVMVVREPFIEQMFKIL